MVLFSRGLAPAILLGLALAACSRTTDFGSLRGTTGGPSAAPAGAPCASDAACVSGICGAAVDGGSGNCCAKACGSDPLCGANACDSTGACIYPSLGTLCGTSCADAILSPRSCDGAGVCRPGDGGRPCPDNFGCADGGAFCNQTCASPFDCAPSFTCKNGVCFARTKTGPCGDNFDCLSEICGADGTGNCCAMACNSTVAPCGAAECDFVTGACLYTEAGTLCGDMYCPTPTLCDGLGHCSATDCAPYLCGVGTGDCLTTCTADSSSCSPGAFCDAANSACCGGLGDGVAVAVDALVGSDSIPCCGYSGAGPCQTIAHAMGLIAAARAPHVTLTATVGSDGGYWPTGNEFYPIKLGWGVELVAPGVSFEALAISTSPDDGGFNGASIVGTAADPVVVGLSPPDAGAPDTDSIVVEPGNTLYIANARLYSSVPNYSRALTVKGGASLVLGQDESGSVPGTVFVGDPAIPGYDGIECEGGCTINDAPLQGMSSVVIQNLTGAALDADAFEEPPAMISLTSAPIVGEPPSSIGFGKCPAKSGGGIGLSGNVLMSFENGTVQCIKGLGFSLYGGYGDGGPALAIKNTTIQNTTYGVVVENGNATISSSIIRYNYVGIWQDNEGGPVGTIDLSGGTQGGRNTVVCTSSFEAGPYVERQFPAIAVLNMTSATLNASNVSWDTPGPDLFMCDPTGTMCTCELPSCVNPGGVDGMDAVEMSTGAITTTGHTLSNADCTAPPPCGSANPCPSGQICCADGGGLCQLEDVGCPD